MLKINFNPNLHNLKCRTGKVFHNAKIYKTEKLSKKIQRNGRVVVYSLIFSQSVENSKQVLDYFR